MKRLANAHELLDEVDNEVSCYRRAIDVTTDYINKFGRDGTAASLTMSINAEIERITGEKAPPLSEEFIWGLKTDILTMTHDIGEDNEIVYNM